MSNFTWIPFYKELAQKLLAYKDKQSDLIDFLEEIRNKGIPSIPLNDKDTGGKTIKLDAIDPFTFFAAFNRGITDDNRQKIAAEVKTKFKIINNSPTDFSGIPLFNNQKSWLFAYKADRQEEDIPLLWEMAENAINNPDNIDPELFDACLNIKGVGSTYLSVALFWFNPDKFAACDKIIQGYLKNNGIALKSVNSFSDYTVYCQTIKDSIPDKPFYQLSYDAWMETSGTGVMKPKNASKRYWLYAPGENAEFWEEFYSKGIMALGWDELADLNTFPDKASIVKRLQEFYETTGSKKNDATANDEFYSTMAKGDIVFVKKGRTELLGFGVVTSDYYYDSSRERYKHCRKVDWKKKGEWSIDHHLAVKTLTDITKYNSEHPDYKLYSDRLMAVINGSYTFQQNEKPPVANHLHPLNQILFGPPGTGKTYNSINHAVAIVEGKTLATIEAENKINRQEILRRFQAYIDSGQVVFTTFHQSMSYEDFVEGIKPVETDEQLNYEVQSGLFKTLAESALANFNNAKKGTGKKSFEAAWEQYLEPLNEEVTIPVKMKKSSYKIVQVNDRTIFFDKNSGESKHTLSVKSLKSMYDAGENQVIKGGLQPYYEALLSQLLRLGTETEKAELKNYVIIIDEINRGNVAQIFGELITLIEQDKRIGNNEALTVTLPYSKKKGFGIPSNLYIIGTMNTADRSVEALDTALRRRFRFIEMPPRYDLGDLENKIADISLKTLLSTLNSRIEKLLDKDHLIGHSYFLQVKNTADLSLVFHQNIIPLLQEYFYGDIAKIGLVLGRAFFQENEEPSKITFARFNHDALDELKERTVYRLKQEWTENEFVQALAELVNP